MGSNYSSFNLKLLNQGFSLMENSVHGWLLSCSSTSTSFKLHLTDLGGVGLSLICVRLHGECHILCSVDMPISLLSCQMPSLDNELQRARASAFSVQLSGPSSMWH